MKIALITGSLGLIGLEASQYFAKKQFKIVGIDNDMRARFFGKEASTAANRKYLRERIKDYTHYDVDIRDNAELTKIFKKYQKDIKYT